MGEKERGGERDGAVGQWDGKGVAPVGTVRGEAANTVGSADSEKSSSRSSRVASSGRATARWRATAGRRPGSVRRGVAG